MTIYRGVINEIYDIETIKALTHGNLLPASKTKPLVSQGKGALKQKSPQDVLQS
jgi:hypothetical protein